MRRLKRDPPVSPTLGIIAKDTTGAVGAPTYSAQSRYSRTSENRWASGRPARASRFFLSLAMPFSYALTATSVWIGVWTVSSNPPTPRPAKSRYFRPRASAASLAAPITLERRTDYAHAPRADRHTLHRPLHRCRDLCQPGRASCPRRNGYGRGGQPMATELSPRHGHASQPRRHGL